MLNNYEQRYIYQHAYLPEHLPGYVCAINEAQPHLIDNYLCFTYKRHLLFVGYPLKRCLPSDAHDAYQQAANRFKPATATLIAEKILPSQGLVRIQPEEHYYLLNFPPPALPTPLAHRVQQTRKKVHIATAKFGASHQKLVDAYCASNTLSSQQQAIFQRIGHYCRTVSTVSVLQATMGEQLVAFSIIDNGSAHHAFYQFHFRNPTAYMPGSSELLFDEILYQAQAREKNSLNMGWGAHSGICQFKENWGGRAYFRHHAVHLRLKTSWGHKLRDALNYGISHRWN